MNLLLLCAGEGTRFRPHTRHTPKPVIPFLNAPLAAYSLMWAQEIACDKLIVNTYHLPDRVRSLFQNLDHGFSELHFSDESPLLMGSGGALAKAKSWLEISSPFIVMNGDEVFLPTRPGLLQKALKLHQDEDRFSTLLVMEHPGVGTQFGGVWADKDHRVLGFGKIPIPGAVHGWHFAGAAIHSRRLLDRLSPEIASHILYDDLTAAIRDGETVKVHPVQGWWHETGNQIDYLEASAQALKLLHENVPEAELLKKVLAKYAESYHIRESADALTLIADSAQLSGDIKWQGMNVVGPNVKISEAHQFRNLVVAANAQIQDLRLEDQLVF